MLSKRKLNAWTHKRVNAEFVKIALLTIPMVICILCYAFDDSLELSRLLDVSILFSFSIVFVCEAIASLVIFLVERKTEDETKVTTDYKRLVSLYSRDRHKMVSRGGCTYPVICDYQREAGAQVTYELNYVDTRYTLPSQIADHYAELWKAHNQSVTYNGITIRLDDLAAQGDRVVLTYRFTTYYDTLLTNRLMDFPMKDGRTVRDIYEPGPFVSPMSESKLSNHIGFNGLVRLKDDKYIFVKRGNKVTTAKGKWSPSISASLKAKYALDEEHRLTMAGIANAIRNEIRDELRMEVSCDDAVLVDSIVGFYRDLAEGGKPHFVFCYENNELTYEEFERKFRAETERREFKKENRRKQIVDGMQIIGVSGKDLMEAEFGIDTLTVKGMTLKMDPSRLSTIVMILNDIEGRNRKETQP